MVLACSSDGGDDGQSSGGSGNQSNGGSSAVGGAAGAGFTKPIGGSGNTSGADTRSGGGTSTVGGQMAFGGSSGVAGSVPSGGLPSGGMPSSGSSSSVAGGATATGSSTTAPSYAVKVRVSGIVGNGLSLQLNGGNTLSPSKDDIYTFPSLFSSDTAYAVTVSSHPASPRQICTVQNGSGRIEAADVTNVAVACSPVARYNLVVDSADNSVSSYMIDEQSGRITYIGRVATGSGPESVAVAPVADQSFSFVYVANFGESSISQFKIHANGILTPLTPPTVQISASAGTHAIAVDPSGKYAYAVNSGTGSGNGSVSQYSIDANGALTALNPATATTGATPLSLTLDPTGKFAYVANSGDGTVSQYAVTNGLLTAMQPATVLAGITPSAITVDSMGRYAYVANAGSASVSQYAIEPATGALKPLPVPAVTTGSKPVALAVDPTGRFAYVVSSGDATVSQYAIGTNGALSPLSPNNVAVDAGPSSIVIEPSGQRVYVSNATDASVSQFTIGTSGVLVANTPPTVPAQKNPEAQAVVAANVVPPKRIAKHVYVANGDDTLWLYSVGTTGALTKTKSLDVAGTGPSAIVVDPSSKFAYVANSGNKSVSQYAVTDAGDLVALSPPFVSAGTYPLAVAVHPKGSYAYVVNQLDRNVSQYRIGLDGTFTPLTPATVLVTNVGNPTAIALDSSGKYAYVPITNGTVAQLTVGIDGKLVAMTPANVPAGAGPSGVGISPIHKLVYVANSSADTISQYSIGSSGGLASLAPPTITTGDIPAAVGLDPTGRYAYVPNAGAPSISQFKVGADGALEPMTPAAVAIGNAASDFPYNIVVDPSGKFAYAPNDSETNGGVWQFSLNQDNGQLTALEPAFAASGMYSRSIAIVGVLP